VARICAGVPFPSKETKIILRGFIISKGVIEYGFGRQCPDGFQKKSEIHNTPSRPSQEIRAFVSKLETRRIQNQLQVHPGNKWQYPGTALDRLFEASYRHEHYRPVQDYKCLCTDCKSSKDPVCDKALIDDCRKLGCTGNLVRRSRSTVQSPHPFIHIDTIASADTVMKSGEHCDSLAQKDRAIGFEMKGAGVWDNLPCIIIKGVCDHANGHKNELWQDYVAATAAYCAKSHSRIFGMRYTGI
jgi:hypothetical protein